MATKTKARPVTLAEFREAILADDRAGEAHREMIDMADRIFGILEEKLGARTAANLERPGIVRRSERVIPTPSHNATTRRSHLSLFRAVLRRGQKLGLVGPVLAFPPIATTGTLPRGTRGMPPSAAGHPALPRRRGPAPACAPTPRASGGRPMPRVPAIGGPSWNRHARRFRKVHAILSDEPGLLDRARGLH
jgi:hypothetical protein